MEKYLHQICDIQYGFPFNSSQFSDTAGTPVIRIRDVMRGYSETFTTEPCDKSYIVHPGDVLIGMDGKFNIAKWGDKPSLLNQRVCRLFPHNCVDSEYLYYFMQGTLKEIEDRTPFATVKHLSAKELNKIVVPLLPVDKQRKVGLILGKVTALISLRKQQLAKLDELVKSRFIEMFGDPEFNPMQWPVVMVGSVIKSSESGWSGNGKQRKKKPGEIAVLKVSAVTKGYFLPEECKVLDDQENIKKYVFPQKGDLLFSRANTREMVGATAVITEDYPELILPDKLWKIRFTDHTNVIYMKHILSSKTVRDKFSSASTGTSGSMYNVSAEKFRSVQILMPPIELQNQFATFVEQVDKSKLEIQKSLEKLEMLKKALMQQYFG